MNSKINYKSNKKILILVILILLVTFISLNIINKKIKSINKVSKINSNINTNIKTDFITNSSNYLISNSSISIPSIFLYNVPIKNGIDNVTLNQYVGHFPSTSMIDGNVGLAAHNRGYENNYFMNINKLKKGDKIIYTINNITKTYEVENIVEIDSYDWSYLNSTEDNRITLITCVDNKPDRRLVVQAVE